jgi:GNAT superfamily N-acetyltransferase
LGPHIRAFEIADATGVSALISTTLRISNVRDYSADFLSKVEASLTPQSLCELAKERVILVAMEGDAIVGTASLGSGQVHAVFVHPARQGQGIGARLMEAVESQARARGERELILYASLSAVAFYEVHGWRTVRKHRDGDARLVVMTKPLGKERTRPENGAGVTDAAV